MVKMGKKKKVLGGKAQPSHNKTKRKGPPQSKDERHARKLERRKKEKRAYTASDWAAPAPSHLVAKLDVPKVKSKHQSYFEFADNPEKQAKRLEFTVTDDANPPPGFTFVPVGHPHLTKKCKELSRDNDAMIFIVSSWKEENSKKISEHVHRTGYHFRETIVDEAHRQLELKGISRPDIKPGLIIEPIPESQEEINSQADAAILDLFPRIPHTDRSMIIEHAFKKGAVFHGEPTVGLQATIPLSRRVQLAVLAHIRHTHTRYDKLLRETSWMNARKAVEPVCLDVLIKWRGDEETGRDQIDEILREVVIISDSEAEDSDSSDDDSSDEEGEVTSVSSAEASPLSAPRNQQKPVPPNAQPASLMAPSTSHVQSRNDSSAVSSRTRSRVDPHPPPRDKKAQRGFSRYQAAWEDAINRRQERPPSGPTVVQSPFQPPPTAKSIHGSSMQSHSMVSYAPRHVITDRSTHLSYEPSRENYAPYVQPSTARPMNYHLPQGPNHGPSFAGDEVNARTYTDRPVYYEQTRLRLGTPAHIIREQRPPQVVRGSPVKRGPEDMPLPSIETSSSNVASPVKERFGAQDMGIQSQDPYPRGMIHQRMQSPAAREVIVINDDNMPVKRRRVAYEDDFSHTRFVSSRDHDLRVPVSNSTSHFVSGSSAQSGGLPAQSHLVSSSAQGLARKEQQFFTDPVTLERLPIYDAPELRYRDQLPAYDRRVVTEPGRHVEYRGEQPVNHYQHIRDNVPVRNMANTWDDGNRGQHRRDPYQYSELEHQHGPGAWRSREYPVSQEMTMSNSAHRAPISAGPDRDLVHSFSQSRLDGPPSQARDGFIVVSERSQHESGHGSVPSNAYHQPRPGAAPHLVRARPPRQCVEQPRYREDELRQPMYVQPTSESRALARSAGERYHLGPAGPPYIQQGNVTQPIYVID